MAVAFEIADVISAARHLHGMDCGLAAEPGDIAAGGVYAAACSDALGDAPGVLAGVDVERRTAPVGLGICRLLLHGEDAVVRVDLDDAALMEALVVGLVVAHDAGRTFCIRVSDEVGEAEVEDVVAGDDEELVVDALLVDGVLDVAHGAEAGLVGAGAVIDDGDALGAGLGPFGEVLRKLVVGDDDVLVDLARLRDVVEEPVEDRLVRDLEEWLGEILRKGV